MTCFVKDFEITLKIPCKSFLTIGIILINFYLTFLYVYDEKISFLFMSENFGVIYVKILTLFESLCNPYIGKFIYHLMN